jgi:hypothetical protein
MTMPDPEPRIESPPSARPALTLIHVLWLASAGGATAIAFAMLRSATWPVRITVTALAFALAIVITHIICVFIVTAVVIPRLGPNSPWRREVDSYMASVFPGKW